MTSVQQVLESSKRDHDRYLIEFREYLSIPSISTLSEHKQDVQRCGEWLADKFNGIGFENVEILGTAGHPVVYGEWLNSPGKPTVLVYGHYDVQPVDPLNEWASPPFEPSVRGDNIYARGASHMKGQGHAVLKALEAWLKSGGLPVNVKMLFKGEEEIGSRNLEAFVEKYKSKLKCDLVLNCDSHVLKPDVPCLVYGLRGLGYFEVWVYGAKSDLHSGGFEGAVHNPAQVLCELIAGMHDVNGHVTLPGFYDKVRVLSKEERAEFARISQEICTIRSVAKIVTV
jgi:acetylornithine deacetylase/succinyl-diaminopimelate desuccinylase-like protein